MKCICCCKTWIICCYHWNTQNIILVLVFWFCCAKREWAHNLHHFSDLHFLAGFDVISISYMCSPVWIFSVNTVYSIGIPPPPHTCNHILLLFLLISLFLLSPLLLKHNKGLSYVIVSYLIFFYWSGFSMVETVEIVAGWLNNDKPVTSILFIFKM